MNQVNIHAVALPEVNRAALEAAHVAEMRIHEHRNGLHPWGSMRRDCPLCTRAT